MNSEVVDLALEGIAWGIKAVVSSSEKHPVDKIALHIATDLGKAVCLDVYHILETQWTREHLVALARVCNVERVELIQCGGDTNSMAPLVFGGDYKLFFQSLHMTPLLLKDHPHLIHEIERARRENSIVIYQKA